MADSPRPTPSSRKKIIKAADATAPAMTAPQDSGDAWSLSLTTVVAIFKISLEKSTVLTAAAAACSLGSPGLVQKFEEVGPAKRWRFPLRCGAARAPSLQ